MRLATLALLIACGTGRDGETVVAYDDVCRPMPCPPGHVPMMCDTGYGYEHSVCVEKALPLGYFAIPCDDGDDSIAKCH